MRTLEEFQKEVLAPLREERDKKHEVALKIKTDGGEAFAKRKKELLDKEVEFKERQKSSLKEFIGKQTFGKEIFLRSARCRSCRSSCPISESYQRLQDC